jgi:hypothetical protein
LIAMESSWDWTSAVCDRNVAAFYPSHARRRCREVRSQLGAVVFSAAQPGVATQESIDLGNGVFTKAAIEDMPAASNLQRQ